MQTTTLLHNLYEVFSYKSTCYVDTVYIIYICIVTVLSLVIITLDTLLPWIPLKEEDVNSQLYILLKQNKLLLIY